MTMRASGQRRTNETAGGTGGRGLRDVLRIGPRFRAPLRFTSALLLGLLTLVAAHVSTLATADAASRIKDLVDVEGVRENQLVGYGLVVGLNGTGDGLNNSPFTRQSLEAMLERMGVNTRGERLKTANVAAVMVTANLPPFSVQGTRIDVTVSAMGDASSLLGGTLLVTPLLGADGEAYAVAQGPLAVGGFTAQGEAASITRGVPTSARIANGALVERELDFQLAHLRSLRLALRNPDFTTAQRIERAINGFLGQTIAHATDPATVRIDVPAEFITAGSGGVVRKGQYTDAGYAGGTADIVGLITEIEQLTVTPDQIARVVIDESTGVIVMGAAVRISTVAVAQGNLTVTITEAPLVSQPAPFSDGVTTAVPRTQVTVDDQPLNGLAIVADQVSLSELVDGLNALGVGPRDMIAILQAIKAAGALQADLELI